MNNYEHFSQDYWFGRPAMPSMQPIWGAEKLLEAENDYSYIKYLYPDICKIICEEINEECDKLEYDGSMLFDMYPDKLSFRRLGHTIFEKCHEKEPDTFMEDNSHIREIIEILLCHEILFRRNRYRNRKRLYL